MDELLSRLQCPATRQPLVMASPKLLDRVNGMVTDGRLTNRLGESITDRLDAALVDQSGTWLYSIRDGIVNMLADEAISVSQLDIQSDEVKA